MMNSFFYTIMHNSLYYINYLVFYLLLAILLKKHVIAVFKQHFAQYIVAEENNEIIIKKETKHLIILERDYKEKQKLILFFKNAIDNFTTKKKNELTLISNNQTELYLKSIRAVEEIEKNIYNQYLLIYSKKSLKETLNNKFHNHNNVSFVYQLISNEK